MAAERAKLKLFVSSRDFFHEQVDSAIKQRGIETFPMVHSYLANLLEHYLDIRNLYEENENTGEMQRDTLAEMFLKAANSESTIKLDLLKKLGDTSLYISGFFGDSLQSKLVDIDYYAEMGGSAYDHLAKCVNEDTFSQVYQEISKRFLEFVDVLTHISHQSTIHTNENLLRLYEKYMKTGSELARDRLLELGLITVPNEKKIAKQ